jgi:hypothetical protein
LPLSFCRATVCPLLVRCHRWVPPVLDNRGMCSSGEHVIPTASEYSGDMTGSRAGTTGW